MNFETVGFVASINLKDGLIFHLFHFLPNLCGDFNQDNI